MSHWVRKCPCPNCWQCAVLVGQAGHKRKWLPNLAQTRWDSPSKTLLHRNSVRYSRSIDQRWMPQCFRGTLGDCLGSLLFLSFLIFFGSHFLILPAYSVNIISFSDSWGIWRLDSYNFLWLIRCRKQVMIESKLGTRLWTHQNKIDTKYFLCICQIQMD